MKGYVANYQSTVEDMTTNLENNFHTIKPYDLGRQLLYQSSIPQSQTKTLKRANALSLKSHFSAIHQPLGNRLPKETPPDSMPIDPKGL